MQDYNWPGNIRELQNVLQRLMTIKRLDLNLMPDAGTPGAEELLQEKDDSSEQGLKVLLDGYEKRLIVNALEKNKWRRGQSASDLQINRRTLFKKMKQYGLE